MISNAKIESTFIGLYKGIPSCQLRLSFDGCRQSFGGYDLRHEDHKMYIFRLLKALKADSWEELSGRYVRIEHNLNSPISRIGHIVEDSWFDPMVNEGE